MNLLQLKSRLQEFHIDNNFYCLTGGCEMKPILLIMEYFGRSTAVKEDENPSKRHSFRKRVLFMFFDIHCLR